jgi:hypothetical protein
MASLSAVPANTAGPAYFTILSTNYLPKALTLADSLQRHHPGSELVVVVIDALRDDQLPALPPQRGVRQVSTTITGLPEHTVRQLATIYDLVEFATAIKPLVFRRLLEDSEQAVYLDPDTYLTAPMVELPGDLAATTGGILLTPHFLHPVTGDAQLSEGHLLTVGVYNLGFGAVDRRARDFLDWWWRHLEWECLWEPLSGLFVDQKWVDIGSVLFHAGAWQHPGYNVSVANLHERPIARDEDGFVVAGTGERLRLFHFHAFDTSRPEELSTRFDTSTAQLRTAEAVDALCREYADQLLRHEKDLAPAPPYPYARDTTGRRISRQLRRAYRVQLQAGAQLPSPFVAGDAEDFARWRRRSAWRSEGKELLGDAAKSVRIALPEEYGRLKERLPGLAEKVRGRFVRSSGIWG